MPCYDNDHKLYLDELLFETAVACENLLRRSPDNREDITKIIECINYIYLELHSRK